MRVISRKITKIGRGILNFLIPYESLESAADKFIPTKVIWVIIAAYKPKKITLELVNKIHLYNPGVSILVVDDCTPEVDRQVLVELEEVALTSHWLKIIRTPTNRLAAGARNFGIEFLKQQNPMPDTLITMDDDNDINENTIAELLRTLDADLACAAVCSQARVINKNDNLLTRLQGLEYHNFNVSRTMDEGFFKGPLVMHGMLSAYRFAAIVKVSGYTEGHLIEDYDLTAKIKKAGWKVSFAAKSEAWTDVPTNLPQLWKQRVRWNYGGLRVVKDNIHQPVNVLQDVIGHFTYLITYVLVLMSYLLNKFAFADDNIVYFLIALAILNFLLPLVFSIYILIYYDDRDIWDVLLRMTIFIEFVYANLLSLVLIGAYAYFIYNQYVKSFLLKTPLKTIILPTIDRFFNNMGFTDTWGTR